MYVFYMQGGLRERREKIQCTGSLLQGGAHDEAMELSDLQVKKCDIIIQSKCTGRQETADSMDKDKDKMIETVIVLIMFEDIRMPMLNTILSETGFDAIGESDNVLTAVALRETTRRRSLPAEGTSTPSILGKLGSTHLNCSTLTSTWPRQGLKQSHTN